MEIHKIPVVWGIDKKYVLQAFVVMHSILSNSDESYIFVIVTADHIETEMSEYTACLKKEYNNFEVLLLHLNENPFVSAHIHNKHLSNAAYFRLLLPGLLPQFNKCIYLDCDLIVHGDLKELFEIELGNNYLAGVRDCHVMEDTPYQKQHQHVLGISSLDRYINSGVLLMNLAKLRDDQMEKAFLLQMKKDNWYEDQDVLNFCCYPLIKILPLEYNLFHFYSGKNIRFLDGLLYEEREFDFNHDRPYILHMGANYKPWNSFRVRGSDEWWKLAEAFQESLSYQYYKRICQKAEEYNDIQDIVRYAQNNRYVVIWGLSQNGKQLCELLLDYQLTNIIAIADNNTTTWGSRYCGIPVKGILEIVGEYEKKDIFWIITCRMAFEEIKEQLTKRGVLCNSIYRYVNHYEKRSYLLSLRENAYEKEIEQIIDMEFVQEIHDRKARKNYILNIIKKPLVYEEEYEYLAKKYNFRYWIQTVRGEEGGE